jgi:hypothetical protein
MFNLLQKFKNTKGQALVEFAVVAPSMVLILLFSQYFYEAYQVKLKAQEIVRYQAYEFTGHELWNWETGQGNYSNVSTTVNDEAKTRYKNLDSSQDNNASIGFAVSWNVDSVESADMPEIVIPKGDTTSTVFMALTGVLAAFKAYGIVDSEVSISYTAMAIYDVVDDYMNDGIGKPHPSWKMNTAGFIFTKSKVSFTNEIIPESWENWFGDIGLQKTLQFVERHYLLADSWKLEHGGDVVSSDVSENVNDNPGYFNQVDRMAFMDGKNGYVRKALKIANYAVYYPTNFLAIITWQTKLPMKDLSETVLVSKGYRNATDGQIKMDEDGGSQVFDTMPMEFTDSPYQNAIENIRGDYYMGCNEEESTNCTSSTSQENPFGALIPN